MMITSDNYKYISRMQQFLEFSFPQLTQILRRTSCTYIFREYFTRILRTTTFFIIELRDKKEKTAYKRVFCMF